MKNENPVFFTLSGHPGRSIFDAVFVTKSRKTQSGQSGMPNLSAFIGWMCLWSMPFKMWKMNLFLIDRKIRQIKTANTYTVSRILIKITECILESLMWLNFQRAPEVGLPKKNKQQLRLYHGQYLFDAFVCKFETDLKKENLLPRRGVLM